MATCIPHTGSVATATTAGAGAEASGGARGTGSAWLALDHLGQDRERDLGGRAGADVQAGGSVQLGGELLGDVELGADRGAALGAGHQRHVADAGAQRLGDHRLLAVAVRGDDHRRRPGHLDAGAGRRAQDVVARRLGHRHDRLGDRRAADDDQRAAGRWGSMKISSAPPLRHGLRSTTAPSIASTPSASPSSGTSRSSSGSPVSIARSECRRTEDSAHTPPTKPSMVPSGSTTAALPGRTLVGRRARTTVASTNGVRSDKQALHVDGEVALNHLLNPSLA